MNGQFRAILVDAASGNSLRKQGAQGDTLVKRELFEIGSWEIRIRNQVETTENIDKMYKRSDSVSLKRITEGMPKIWII